MKLDYNLPLEFGDYLDKLKMSMIMAKDFRLSPFYIKNTTILSKILFLAWQKGLVSNELLDILDYIPTNEKVLELVYEYKGVASRPIMIKAISVMWNIKNFETLENEIKVEIETPAEAEEAILRAETDDSGNEIPLIYVEIPLTTIVKGNQTTALIISFIKLFLPAGVWLNVYYTESVKSKEEAEELLKKYQGARLVEKNNVNLNQKQGEK
ncbi:MAG: hypothetical protein LBH40_05890 [Alphaproteobacteria bacterium]|jgi:hypothetical protein|nr:hypothetical protein [Alphaproteobacteria bacterium]